jgi:hypothetical protein
MEKAKMQQSPGISSFALHGSLLALCLTFAFQCNTYSPNGAEYWENSNSLNQSIQDHFRGTNFFAILMGNLNPKDESLLDENEDGSLEFKIQAKRKGSGWVIERVQNINRSAEYSVHTLFQKTTWNREELYEITRKQKAILGDFKPSLAFQSLHDMIAIRPDKSKYQEWLCKAFDCLVEDDKTSRILSYTFSGRTKETYPEMYEKYASRFESLRFQAFAIPDGHRESAIEVENIGKKLLIHLPSNTIREKAKSSAKDWLSPKRVDIVLDFRLNTFGVSFEVKKLRYTVFHTKLKSSELLTGGFTSNPSPKIEGRFFYIIPPGVVDLFIPGNIEEYLKKGLTLLTVGSDGKKGTRFRIQYFGTGKSAYYLLENNSESYRKKFSLFSNSKDTENEKANRGQENFFRDMWISIAKDLRSAPVLLGR